MSFFETIFRRDTHPHPLIYIRDLNSEELEQVLHFMYFGEVSIAEDQLEAFLALAEDFHLNAFQSSTDHKSMGQCGKSELTQHASTEVAGKYFEKEKVYKTSEKVKVDKSSEKVKVDTFSEKVKKYSEKVIGTEESINQLFQRLSLSFSAQNITVIYQAFA